jgi:IMP dehydrogenase
MIGGLFAETWEAAGKGKFRGQASAEFQKEFYGGLKEGTVPEGVSTEILQHRSAQELIDELIGGLRSGMTYGGARTIEELQRKAEFERITPNYF